MSSSFDSAIWSVDLQAKLLVNEQESQAKHAQDLRRRLQEAQDQNARMESRSTELHAELREARRKQHEAESQAEAAKSNAAAAALRHDLALKVATENAHKSQKMLTVQGQELHNLQAQLQTFETEVARLKIEKEGSNSLAVSFQGRLEDMSRVVAATGRNEAWCVVRGCESCAPREVLCPD